MKRAMLNRVTVAMGFLLTSLGVNAMYPDLPIGIKNGSGALVGDTVYVGYGSAGNRLFALNLKDGSAAWTEIKNVPDGERNQPVLAAVDGHIYVFGGARTNAKKEVQLVNDVYRYDPSNDTWTKLPTRSPLGITGASGVVHQGKVYFVGGVNQEIFNGFFQDFVGAEGDADKQAQITHAYFNQRPQDYFFNKQLFSYEPKTNQWRNEGVMPFEGRAGAVLGVNQDRLIVVNGEIKPGLRTAKTHEATFGADGQVSCKNLPDLPGTGGKVQDGLAGALGGYLNGYYLVTGGANFPGSTEQFAKGQLHAHKGLSKTWHQDVFALNQGKWQVVGTFPQPIAYGVAVTYGDSVVVIGGETEAGAAVNKVYQMRFDGQKLSIDGK